jgi:hypothetical protein
MDFSKFCSSFCNSTSIIVCYEVNENMMKSFVKSGLDSIGYLVSASLISSKYVLASRFHLILFPFLSMQVMFFMIYAKFEMNLLKKFTFPRKDCTYFLLRGVMIFKIPSTLLGSILIPYLEIMCPKKFPSSTLKCEFFGFSDMLNFLHFWKTLFRCSRCSLSEVEYTMMSSR